jgi:hypothetical protein
LRQNTRPFVSLEATKIRRASKQLENDLYVIPRLGVNARAKESVRLVHGVHGIKDGMWMGWRIH